MGAFRLDDHMKPSVVAACRGAIFVLFATSFLVGVFHLSARAGIRAPGKYSGVVFFDRWDTCVLINGRYVTYVAEGVKEELRKYAGVAVQIDASDVVQPMNPGDALVRKYKLLGLAPEPDERYALDSVHIRIRDDVGGTGRVAFVVSIDNL